jgi:hypothetical protein
MAKSNYDYDHKDNKLIIFDESSGKVKELPDSRDAIRDLSQSNQREQHNILKAKWELYD